MKTKILMLLIAAALLAAGCHSDIQVERTKVPNVSENSDKKVGEKSENLPLSCVFWRLVSGPAARLLE